MRAIYWYSLLGIIGLVITIFTIYKKREIANFSTFLVFFLFSTCVTWIGEFIVLGLFNSYAYKTGIYTSPWAENILGHLILNSTLYPGTALFVATYSLGYGWISLISLIYVLLDYLFTKLRIYEHHWWQFYMTFLSIFVFQIISREWFKKIIKGQPKYFRISTFYFAGFVLLHYPIPIMLLLGKQYYDAHLVQDIYLSSTLFIFSYQLIENLILIYFVCILKKWYWKLIPFVIGLMGQSILLKTKILVIQDGWNFFYTMVLYFISITSIILIGKYSLKPKKVNGSEL